MVKKVELLSKTTEDISKHGEISINIADYLEQLLIGHGIAEGEQLELPSLSQLADFLSTRQMTIHNALQVLRKRGYDYAIHGLSTPLIFWQRLVILPDELSNNGKGHPNGNGKL